MSAAAWAWIILAIIVVLFILGFGIKQIPVARRYLRAKRM
jgi:hypothetical protein